MPSVSNDTQARPAKCAGCVLYERCNLPGMFCPRACFGVAQAIRRYCRLLAETLEDAREEKEPKETGE